MDWRQNTIGGIDFDRNPRSHRTDSHIEPAGILRKTLPFRFLSTDLATPDHDSSLKCCLRSAQLLPGLIRGIEVFPSFGGL
jgi:hypothetical protein